jgi:predicted dehydrogenase
MRIGFLGGGVDSIAGKVHMIASQMDKKFEVVGGIFSHIEEKSKQSAKEYKVKHFNSIEEMANNVDVITILTPTPNHYENLKEILQYDVKIIVDKPLVSNTTEIDKLNLNKDIVVTHNYSGYPLVREIKELVKNGVLGDIKKIKINMAQESFFKPMKPGYPQKWRLVDGEIPTIALDLGVHTYHLARFILGKKFKPFFCEKNSFSKFDVIDDCIVLAKSDEVLVELSFSKISLGNSNPLFIEVYGDKAGVKWSQESFEELVLTFANGKKEILTRSYSYFEANKPRYQRMAPGHPSGFIDAFANLYSDIYDKFNGIDNYFVSDANESFDSIKFFKEVIC